MKNFTANYEHRLVFRVVRRKVMKVIKKITLIMNPLLEPHGSGTGKSSNGNNWNKITYEIVSIKPALRFKRKFRKYASFGRTFDGYMIGTTSFKKPQPIGKLIIIHGYYFRIIRNLNF